MVLSNEDMKFRTEVTIDAPEWRIEPDDRVLCVGSCFAQRIGERMRESCLQVCVNPWGTLYNPASIAEALRTAGASEAETAAGGSPAACDVLVVTLGTTHVFMRDGRVVANCQRLPARLFTERDLSVAEIVADLGDAIGRWRAANSGLRVLLTVSPYRYANWSHEGRNTGLHGNQLSKARLLLAVDELVRGLEGCAYFPAYEIVLDELRDYRFYDADMLHPSQQAVDYIWERFVESMLSARCRRFIAEMEPVRKALAHRPHDPESDEYRRFRDEMERKRDEIVERFLKNKE